MEVHADTVRIERNKRGWTQQHLADAAGCSLRTIQRIEKQGLASNESVSALCAVFEVRRDRLLRNGEADGSGDRGTDRRVPVLVGAAALAGAGAGAALTWVIMMAGGG